MPKNVKNTTFPSLLDLIAPHSCRGCGAIGSVLCHRCKKDIIKHHVNLCPNCKSINTCKKCPNCLNLPATFVVGYRQELIGQLAQDFKFHSIRSLAKPLAEILNQILPKFKDQTIIIPLPTINKHIRERGLDHTYIIAKHLARIRGNNYQAQKILTRISNTVQVGSDKKTRFAQAASAYKINPKAKLEKSTNYILLDDIWTTGSSMLSATKLLQQAGVKKINIVVLAVS